MTPILINIPHEPVAQGRPRFFSRGNHVGAYDPLKSKNWKRTVMIYAKQQYQGDMLLGALLVEMCFFTKRPIGLKKSIVHNIKRPDITNYIKGIEDALNGIIYKDDSQIVTLLAYKQYAESAGSVGVDILIKELS